MSLSRELIALCAHDLYCLWRGQGAIAGKVGEASRKLRKKKNLRKSREKLLKILQKEIKNLLNLI